MDPSCPLSAYHCGLYFSSWAVLLVPRPLLKKSTKKIVLTKASRLTRGSLGWFHTEIVRTWTPQNNKLINVSYSSILPLCALVIICKLYWYQDCTIHTWRGPPINAYSQNLNVHSLTKLSPVGTILGSLLMCCMAGGNSRQEATMARAIIPKTTASTAAVGRDWKIPIIDCL